MTNNIPKFVYYCNPRWSPWPVCLRVLRLSVKGVLQLDSPPMDDLYMDMGDINKRIIFTRWTRALDWMGQQYKDRARAMDEEIFLLASDMARLPY